MWRKAVYGHATSLGSLRAATPLIPHLGSQMLTNTRVYLAESMCFEK
jgi:hypothetical protein